MRLCALITLLLMVHLSMALIVTDARLPRHIRPEEYEINLIPSFQENNFTLVGSVNINLDVLEDSNNITLQILDITIKKTELRNAIGGEVKIQNTTDDRDKEFYIIQTEETMKANSSYLLKIDYEGELNDKLVGFYRSSYIDPAGKTRWLGATQFQLSDARRAFPCFDEPDFKAKFRVSIARPKHLNSISNMPIMKTELMEGRPDWEVDYFQESVKMSTYLVAFVVSDFKYKTVNHPGNTTFRIYGRKEVIDNGEADFAGEIFGKIVDYFADYFGVPYPLPKLDKVALPDFAYGAMENWGLITYRETLLLNRQTSTAKSTELVALVIAHELAHMWFGNLVTPKWWNGLWLSEGFSVHFEGFALDHVRPAWRGKEMKFSKVVQQSMKTDALQSTEAIFVGKSAAVIRMMSMFLTENTLKKGLSKYLTEFKYKNTEADDVWRHMTEQAHEDGTLPNNVTVKEIMDTWILQKGFPVIKVNRNYEEGSANVSQERFLLLSKPNTTYSEQKWWIPLTYTSQGNINFNISKPSAWMNRNQTEITIENIGPNQEEWVIFNIEQAGYYRVCYDGRNWKLIMAQLEKDHEVIPAQQRAQILNDALNLARAKHMDYNLALSLTTFLSRERCYIPLKSGLNELEYIWDMLIRTAGAADFSSYMKGIIYPLYKEVQNQTWETDNDYTDIQNVYWKVRVTKWACELEHKGCISSAKDQFSQFMQNYTADTADQPKNGINPNLKSTVYCTAIKFGGEEEWLFLWEHYKNARSSSEKNLVLRALACSRNIWILSRYLDWILDESSGIRKQDGTTVFRSIALNPIARCLAWNFLRSNWKKINELHGAVFHSVRSFISSSTRDFNTKNEVEQVKQFYQKNKEDFGKATNEVIQSIERAEGNYNWMQDNYEHVVQWLRQNKPLNATLNE